MQQADIPGQFNLKSVFKQLVEQQRVPHAMLIHGKEGGASLPLGIYLIQLMLCEDRDGAEPCGVCSECTRVSQHIHPDVHYIFPVNTNKKNKRTEDRFSDNFLEDWRGAMKENPFLELIDWYRYVDIENKQGLISEAEGGSLRKKLALRSFEGGYRFFLIWHADKMNDTFANKILKNLEEPSSKTVFILISDQPARLLSTITSRVQVFQEEHIDEPAMAEWLESNYDLDREQAMSIAFRAEGNVNQAIKAAQNQQDPWLDEFKTWMRLAYKRDVLELHKWSEQMARNTRDAQREYCRSTLRILDRCYRMGWLDLPLSLEGEDGKFISSFSPFINSTNIEGFMNVIEEASFHIERNVSEKIVWFDTSIEAIRLIHAGKLAVKA